MIDGVLHNRPCFFAFWNRPWQAYSISNSKYLSGNRELFDRIAAGVEKNARDVLAIAKRGVKVIFPDVFTIYRELE